VTQVFSYGRGLSFSDKPGEYYAGIGFELVATGVGPVWTDARNVATVLQRYGQAPAKDWPEDAVEDNDNGPSDDDDFSRRSDSEHEKSDEEDDDLPPPPKSEQRKAVLPSRSLLTNLNAAISQQGVHYDGFAAWTFMAQRQPTLEAIAAHFVFKFVRGHAFGDGNKRTGAKALEWIAKENGRGALIGSPNAMLLKAADLKSGYTEDDMAKDMTSIFAPAKRY
jgi:hypothetical protein